MQLGRIGIWTYHLNYQPTSKVRQVVASWRNSATEHCGSAKRCTGSH
jgi:hypothetical protein